jgi:hypothetical protein
MRLLLALVLILVASTAEAACRTITLPNSDGGDGGFWSPPFGGARVIDYRPPAGATSVGLEFWFHQFSGSAPQGTQQFLVYINRPDTVGQRIFHNENVGTDIKGEMKTFALSIHLNPGEQLVVGHANWTSVPQFARLIVTVRECMP